MGSCNKCGNRAAKYGCPKQNTEVCGKCFTFIGSCKLCGKSVKAHQRF